MEKNNKKLPIIIISAGIAVILVIYGIIIFKMNQEKTGASLENTEVAEENVPSDSAMHEENSSMQAANDTASDKEFFDEESSDKESSDKESSDKENSDKETSDKDSSDEECSVNEDSDKASSGKTSSDKEAFANENHDKGETDKESSDKESSDKESTDNEASETQSDESSVLSFEQIRQQYIDTNGYGCSEGQVLPDFTFTDLNGNQLSNKDFLGKPAYFNFFTTWCYYCCLEMPDLNDSYLNNKDNMSYVVLDLGEGAATAQNFAETNGYSLPMYLMNDYAIGSYSISGIPVSVVVDEYGVVVGFQEGMVSETWINSMVTKAIGH